VNRARKGDSRKEITLEARGSEAGRACKTEGRGVPAKKVKITRASALPPQEPCLLPLDLLLPIRCWRESNSNTHTDRISKPYRPFQT
jgi:hypothetical protein